MGEDCYVVLTYFGRNCFLHSFPFSVIGIFLFFYRYGNTVHCQVKKLPISFRYYVYSHRERLLKQGIV